MKKIIFTIALVFISDISQIRADETLKKDASTITTKLSKASAHISIYSAELFASNLAEKELKKFRTGRHNGTPNFYPFNSQGQIELFDGAYYQELTQHLILELAKWYKGKIPHSGGLFLQNNSFRIFSPQDAMIQLMDGIDMDDIIGTFTYYVRLSTDNGIIHFSGINMLSLESYSGENYLKHGLVTNPEKGALSSTAQVFEWQVIIPKEYRREN